MTSGSFRAGTVVRVLAIASLIVLFILVLLKTNWVITGIVLFIAIASVTYDLIRYVEAGNRNFSNFLLSIRSSDFTKYNIEDKRGRAFTELNYAFNAIIEEFRNARIDKEAQYTFLQAAIGNLNTAIISFDSTGEVKLINEAANSLLNISGLNHIKRLQLVSPELSEHLMKGHNEVVEVTIKGERLKLLLRFTSFKLRDLDHKLVLITNVKTEIDRAETEAWQQLLRVLTHEIMNSVTPISSLSDTIKNEFDEIVNHRAFDKDRLNDLSNGLSVIKNRSGGLITFVQHYKSLIDLPTPEFNMISVTTMLERIGLLAGQHIRDRGINFSVVTPIRPFMITVDERMMEQVILNLLYNAADAVQSTPSPNIVLAAEEREYRTLITVQDNGPGIEAEILDKIFIPFFTTKTNGTGIGLSLSKQIMHLHKGSIDVNSILHKGTNFSLILPRW